MSATPFAAGVLRARRVALELRARRRREARLLLHRSDELPAGAVAAPPGRSTFRTHPTMNVSRPRHRHEDVATLSSLCNGPTRIVKTRARRIAGVPAAGNQQG